MNEVNCKSALIGCFGQPIWENPTEFMMEASFKHHHLKMRYISTEVSRENLTSAFEGVKAMGYKGFNCTIPHKQAIIPLLDGLSESAELIGAVNCVVERDGKYFGENTDGKGYLTSIQELTDPKGKKVVLIGAGGAARAIAIELALVGVREIIVVNRNVEKAQELSCHLKEKTSCESSSAQLGDNYVIPENTDIVINATCIGMYPNLTERVPVDIESFKPHMIVSDVIINPPQTSFLQEAASKGCTTLDGLGMVVNQAVICVKVWSGVDVDPRVMQQTLYVLFEIHK